MVFDTLIVTYYITPVIGTFRNKALKRLCDTGQTKGLKTGHVKRIKTVLSMLSAASTLAELNVPGFFLHRLEGKPARHSMRVSGNWRITFEWRKGTACKIDYEDYH